MSDENIAGDATPPNPPAESGAFDWLRESHQQSAPLAPLSDDVPSAAAAVPADPNSAVPADQPQPWAPSPAVPAAAPPQPQQPIQVAPPQQPLPPVQVPQPPQYATTPTAPEPLISPAEPTQAPPVASAPPPWTPAPSAEVPPAWSSAPQPPAAAPPAWTPTPPPAAAAPPTWTPPPAAAAPPAATPPAWGITPAPTAEAPSAPAAPAWTPNPEPTPAAPPSWGSSAAEAPPAPAPATEPQVPLIPRPSFMSAPEHQPVASATPAQSPFADLTAGSADSTQQSSVQTGFGGGFGLERHQTAARSGNGPLDWAALVLAIITPPLGIIVAIVALVVGSRTKGFATGVAKAALAIAIVLSIVLTVGYVVVSKLNNDQAHHDAIAASSQAWCTQLKADPATLSSDTYGWPAPGKTIPDTITSIQAYVDKWAALDKVAPKGIEAATAKIEGAAKQILSDLKKSQTLDDASNVQNMQSAVSTSQIGSWVTQYCK